MINPLLREEGEEDENYEYKGSFYIAYFILIIKS